MSVQILSDSEFVVGWPSRHSKVNGSYCHRIAAIQNCLQELWQTSLIAPRLPWMDIVRQIYREFNELANGAAKEASTKQTGFCK